MQLIWILYTLVMLSIVSRSFMIGSICSCLWLFVLAWQLAVKIDPLSHPHLMVNKLIHVTPSSQGNFSWWKLANTKWSNICVSLCVCFLFIHSCRILIVCAQLFKSVCRNIWDAKAVAFTVLDQISLLKLLSKLRPAWYEYDLDLLFFNYWTIVYLISSLEVSPHADC